MGRRRKGRNIHGVLLLDKPAGLSSNQAVQQVRRLFNARKAGHTGSLDPFATGMLAVCLGEATKTAGHMLESNKTYQAIACLGQKTDTGDTEGTVIDEQVIPDIDENAIRRACEALTGVIQQVPPMYSALKHGGKRLYQLARAGQIVERALRPVKICRLELTCWRSPDLAFELCCSKGTYVRTLAEDLAHSLGCCAHLQALRRTEIEAFAGYNMVSMASLEQAVEDGKEQDLLLPMDVGLGDWASVTLGAEDVVSVSHGNAVNIGLAADNKVLIRDAAGTLLALGKIDAGGSLQPVRVFVLDQGRE